MGPATFFVATGTTGRIPVVPVAAGLTAGGRPLSREEEFGKDQSRLS
jgi:hypothetical protein